MLRSIIKSKHILLASRKTMSTAMIEPSTKTTVILRNLNPSTTEASLKAAIAEVKCRKVEMEPGCSIHVRNEAEATYISNLVKTKFDYESVILSTSIPTLLLENLPASICTTRLGKAFGKFQPKLIRLVGGASVQITAKSAEDALVVQGIVSKIFINEIALQSHTVKLPDQTFAVVASNFHNSTSVTEAEKVIREALRVKFSEENIETKTILGAPKSASLRFKTTNAVEVEAIVQSLHKISINGQRLIVSEPKQVKKPALFIRNVLKIGPPKLEAVMSQMGCDRLRINNRTKDTIADLAVAFFSTEEAAFQALHQLRNIRVEGVKIVASYRSVAEPAVTLRNLPENYTEEALMKLFDLYKPVRAELSTVDGVLEGVVVLGGPADVDLASMAMSRKVIGGKLLICKPAPVHDTGIDITLPYDPTSSAPDSLNTVTLYKAIMEAGAPAPKGISINTNISAFIGFMTIGEATTAHSSFVEGSTVIDEAASSLTGNNAGGLVASHISAHPAFVVEIAGLKSSTPVQPILAAMTDSDNEEGDSNKIAVNTLRVDRSAIVKFKKANDVVTNMKILKTMKIDGSKIHVSRFRPVVKLGTHEIDEVGDDEEFDQYALMSVMKDYMHADQATRYQVVKNHFERAVNDCKNKKNFDGIIDDSYTASMKEEVKKLVALPIGQAIASDRLFELYTQRQDMNMMTHDFRDSEAIFGPANPEDQFDWSQFLLENHDDMTRYEDAVKLADLKFTAEANRAAGIEPKKSNNQIKRELRIEVDEGEEEKVISLEKVSELTDKEGRVWSGAILDTDMVQKTMPGGRIMSHRALVVVGNLRGAAGFGMGKAKNSADAITAAFRDALRNLVFIDLYEQFGFAHDLHGKHNSCHAYIRATGRNRMMVGSPFATAVLERFGVGSASIKLVGRRDPYAMVRAIFNAVVKHENIDEFAKDRGKRYLSIKWMYDKGI